MQEMKVLATSGCAGKHCPTVYWKDDETLIIQGYKADGLFNTELPDGEQAVAVPVELLRKLAL